jgi:hypothetical protein
MTQNEFPEGWDEQRVRALITYYEQQTEDEVAFAEYYQTLIEQKPNTVWAVVRKGKIELLEQTPLPEGMRVLVTLLPDAMPSLT